MLLLQLADHQKGWLFLCLFACLLLEIVALQVIQHTVFGLCVYRRQHQGQCWLQNCSENAGFSGPFAHLFVLLLFMQIGGKMQMTVPVLEASHKDKTGRAISFPTDSSLCRTEYSAAPAFIIVNLLSVACETTPSSRHSTQNCSLTRLSLFILWGGKKRHSVVVSALLTNMYTLQRASFSQRLSKMWSGK